MNISLSAIDLIFSRMESAYGPVSVDSVGLGGPRETVMARDAEFPGVGGNLSDALSDFAWRNNCPEILDVND
jgi:hypothetical protein